jgi:hypothetical protein
MEGPTSEGEVMDNPFDWLTSKFKQPLSLAFFVLGALLILLGITTSLEIPGLKHLVADPSFRWISIAFGFCLLLIALFIAYRPPPQPEVLQDAGNLPIPEDLKKSFTAKRDSLGDRQTQILNFVISEATRYGSVSYETVARKFNSLSGSEVWYRLEYLRLLSFIEKGGENVYRLSKAYEQERENKS